MNKLPSIVVKLIASIFDLQLVDLTEDISNNPARQFAFQMRLFELQSEMLSYVRRIQNSIVSISQMDNGQYIYSLTFKTNPEVEDDRYTRRVEVVINPFWDGFDIYEVHQNGTIKTLVHQFKTKSKWEN